MRATIDVAGRIVIPEPIRQQAGWRVRTELDVRLEDGEVRISAVAGPGEIIRKNGLPVWRSHSVARMTVNNVNAIIDEVRNGE